MILRTAGVSVRLGFFLAVVTGFACAESSPVPGRATGAYALACQSAPQSLGLPTALERVAWFENVSGQWLSWEVGEWLQSNLAVRVWAELTDEERSAIWTGEEVTEKTLADLQLALSRDSLSIEETDAAMAWLRAGLDKFAAVVTASWESCIWLDAGEEVEIVRSGTFEGLRVYEVRTHSDSTLYWTVDAVENGADN